MNRLASAMLMLPLCLLLAGSVVASDAAMPQVQVEGGALTGTSRDGIRVFMGIPYAAPPVGELRWRKPGPVQPWQGARDATVAAPACPQAAHPAVGQSPPRQSEDCLYLNVWSPQKAVPEHPLPVMVWIHGGANRFGAGH